MATQQDLAADLGIVMTEVRRTLDHYKMGHWQEYLVIRQQGKPGSFVVLAHPADKSDFQDRLVRFHEQEANDEFLKGEG